MNTFLKSVVMMVAVVFFMAAPGYAAMDEISGLVQLTEDGATLNTEEGVYVLVGADVSEFDGQNVIVIGDVREEDGNMIIDASEVLPDQDGALPAEEESVQ